MNRSFLITLASALLVFVVGSGIGRATSAASAETEIALALDADGRPLFMLPTVVVSATAPSAATGAATASADAPNVLLDDAVSQAKTAIAGGVGYGVRRAGLAIPYYAFGRSARNTE